MIQIIYTNNKRYIKKDVECEIPIYEYIDYIDLRKEVGNFIRYIENQKVNGISIEDVIIYDNIPLYIFFRPDFSKWMSNVVEYVFILDRVTKKEEVTIKTSNKLFKKIANDIFKVKCELIEEDEFMNKRNKSNLSLSYFLRTLKGLKNYSKFFTKSKFNKKKNILTFTMATSIAELKYKHGNEEFYDYQYGELLNELEKSYNILNFQLLQSMQEVKKANKYNNNFVPFEFAIIKKKILDRKLIKSKLINNNVEIIQQLDYTFGGYNLESIIKEYLLNRLEKVCFSYLKEMNYIKSIIKKYNIDKCIVIDEGDRGRCFITAGNVLNKDTYAIQHGIIVKNSHSYHVNSKHENIVPKKTFLWGERYRDILINNTNIYNEKNLAVVGQIRTEYIDKFLYSKEQDKGEKNKLLFISQYMDDLVKPAAKILFEGLGKWSTPYEIIIKLHPGEDTYHKYYEELIETYRVSNVKIVKDKDLYELLNWSDVVISVHSTVILEAGFLNKPSICIRIPKFDDICEFVKDGLSIGAKNSDEILEILDNKTRYFNDEYYSRVKNYMSYSFKNMGGSITETIKSIILKD